MEEWEDKSERENREIESRKPQKVVHSTLLVETTHPPMETNKYQ